MEQVSGSHGLTVTSVLQVSGMDCADCAAKLEKAVRRVPGVVNASAAFITGRLNLEYDPALTGLDPVLERVQSLGYSAKEEAAGAKAPEKTRSSTIRIGGMDCMDCAAKLEKRVRMVPGVKDVRINFGAARMEVTHSGPVSEIVGAIRELGYAGQSEDSPRPAAAPAPLWSFNRYTLPTVVSGAVILLAAILEYLGVTDSITHLIFAAAIVLGGFLPARNGLSMLINARELDMNALMTVAAVGAVAIGQYEEGAVVVFLFSLGNALQAYTLDKTRNSIRSLMELTPNQALVQRNGLQLMLPVEEIRIGDTIIARPGERIPMDGRVIGGASTVNQAPITGESIPVEKQPGDEVFAGTINERGSLEIEVTRLSKDNTIARIIELVEEAQGQRAPSQQFVDRFARYYTPLVLFAAALVAIVPWLVFNQPFDHWFYEALAMLLVACPCALVISTPVSIVSAIGSAARNGVLIKGGAYLEEAGSLSVVAFDKTGTLTEGRPRVTDVVPLNGFSIEDILSTAAAIESRSEHPLAEAIVNYAKSQGHQILPVTGFEAVFGLGARGEVGGRAYHIGNVRYFNQVGVSLTRVEKTIEELQNEGKTVMVLGNGETLLGIIAVADVTRTGSQPTVKKLKQAGIKRVVMLTGDNQRTAAAIAARVGVDEYMADLLPEDKVEVIRDLLTRFGKVAMVGDGVNDAPAMAISTVGIAMGTAGSDTALETADIALMADDLTRLPYAIKLSRRTLRTIKQNITLSLVIKGIILLLVIPGWLTLWIAVAADMGSSLLVTLNGMRLMRVRHSP
ncbi:MAG: cadmium-translocating P-type ATPase [Firmicutes bacterium]|nr:cadmium-translocating P-type ATPase [Bacillota bacterium]